MKSAMFLLIGVLLLLSGSVPSADLVLKPVLIGIYVRSYDESVSWYCDNLNFRIEKEVVNDDVNLRIGFLDNGAFELEIYADIIPDSTATPLARDRFGMPAEGFTKLSLETTDLERLNRVLKSKDVEFVVDTKASERKAGQSWFMIKDPDGNLIQVFGRSPERR